MNQKISDQNNDDQKPMIQKHLKKRTTSSKTIALVLRAMLLALAFILSFIDHSLPSIFPAFPQFSLGLSNIVVLFALIFLTWKDALFLTIAKSFMVIFVRGAISFYLSISGGLLALLIEIIIWKITKKESSLIFLSAFGGLSHNIGQVLAYSVYAQVKIWILLPPLSILGIISGILTALVLRALFPYFVNWFNYWEENSDNKGE